MWFLYSTHLVSNLIVKIFQQIPNVSPTGRYTTAFPLLFILSVSAVKEFIEDWVSQNPTVQYVWEPWHKNFTGLVFVQALEVLVSTSN